MTTIEELRNSLSDDEAYRRKQMHPVPESRVVDREAFILQRCKGKIVLDIGATGYLHDGIVEVAKFTNGITKPATWEKSEDWGANWRTFYMDLDDICLGDKYSGQLPKTNAEIVVCGEVLEHLSNPGWFLTRLREAYRCATIITVPNAFSEGARRLMERGTECVNFDHVCWYSYTTLKELLRRHGYEIKEHYWYSSGRARFTEGLIVVTE